MPVCIDINDSYIKIIEGEQQGNKIKVNKAIIKNMDLGCINNGYILNKIDLTLMLTELVEEHKLKKKDCFLTINSTDIITKEIILPKAKHSDLQKLVKNSLKELFNDITNFIIDYEIYKEFKEEEKTFYTIFVYAIPIKIVQDFKTLITNCGLIPKVLDIKRNVIGKALEYQINSEDIRDKTTLFLEISGNSMILTLMEGNVAIYKRDIDISEDVKRELLFFNKAKEDEEKEENQDFIEEVAVTNHTDDNEITFLNNQDYFQEEASFISPILVRIYEEINKIIQFCMSLNNLNIEKAYLYGDRDDLDEIAEYVSNNIIFGTQKIEEVANLKSNKDIDTAKFFNCIGNILRK